jgi:hypothetical protein
MKRELKIGDSQIITIKNGIVLIPQSGEMRMTVYEIAALFEVYAQTVNANIKAVLKSGVVKPDVSCPATVSGNIILPDTYGLEMITVLSFRIKSKNAEIFRNWLMRKMVTNTVGQQILINIRWGDRALLN